jgi:hypothetical protein
LFFLFCGKLIGLRFTVRWVVQKSARVA